MRKRVLLGVSVGESFATFGLLQQNGGSSAEMQLVATKRSYIPREPLKTSLQQFLSAHPEHAPEALFLNLRFLEKLLDYRLGNSVAQIVTEGFEHWAQLRNCSPDVQPLSSQELVFSLRERLHADGSEAVPVDETELESIAAKLQLMECKRVCVHLLHSALNAAHETKVAEFFKARGFEVFVPEKSDNQDEVSRWRRNTLNASISGTFTDLQTEIVEAVKEIIPAEKVFFMTGQNQLFHHENHLRLTPMFSSYSAMAQAWGRGSKPCDILFLGLEKFALIYSQQQEQVWQSPWGAVENPHTAFTELKLQPTSSIALNLFNHVGFGSTAEGWEPGPMFMGRGQKATLLDLWCEDPTLAQIVGLQDRVVPAGVQRFKNTLMALAKASAQNAEVDTLMKTLREHAVQRLVMEVSLLRQSENLLVTGPLASLFAAGFKKTPAVQVLAQDFIETQATAMAGSHRLGAST